MKKKVEAYGVKGLKSVPWRKTFPSAEALVAWAEKNDAEIYASRNVEGSPISGSAGARAGWEILDFGKEAR